MEGDVGDLEARIGPCVGDHRAFALRGDQDDAGACGASGIPGQLDSDPGIAQFGGRCVACQVRADPTDKDAHLAGGGQPVEMQRIGAVRHVVDADHKSTEQAQASARSAVAAAVDSEREADLTTATVGDSEAKLRDLNQLLGQAQATLDDLDARARSLEEAERAAAALAAARAAADSARWNTAATAKARGIPVTFLALYRAAATTCPGLPWPVLAAIGQVESGHGSNPNDSYAGAQGPMQFLPSTFKAYAVDGDGDGLAEIRNPADAIYSAARYLCANRGGESDQGLRGAIWNYNHADWYVAMVLRIGGQIAERFNEPPVAAYAPRSS